MATRSTAGMQRHTIAIQSSFEELADLIIHTKPVIDRMCKAIPIEGQINPKTLLAVPQRRLTLLLQKLIASAFIVEKQPPQVMKTHIR